MFLKKEVSNRLPALLISILVSGNIFVLSAVAQGDDIDVRIKRQMHRINNGEKERYLKAKQAKQLKDALNDIALRVEAARKKSNGKLTENQITKFDNDLNQNSNNIKTQLGAGKKVKEPGSVLGPNWATDTDGAQDPKTLRRQMKLQEQRQLKQYGQSMQQVQEMQQQQYEKDMLKTLGQQRPQILKNKQELEKVREETGAN
jgi:hypothetical protein